MKLFDRFQHWAAAVEDIEDPRGAEMRQLREQLQSMEVQRSGLATDAKRELL